MQTRRKLLAGQPGTKKWLARYGDKLVCVRYRYDAENKKRFKTVELIVAEDDWEPNPERIPGNKIVAVRVRFGEVELGRSVRAAGGAWHRDEQVWTLPYREVLKLGLQARIVAAARPSKRPQKNVQ